jgi:hypothetical protein
MMRWSLCRERGRNECEREKEEGESPREKHDRKCSSKETGPDRPYAG